MFLLCDEQSRWLNEIQKSDWGAGQYLYELLRDHRLKEHSGAIGIWENCWIMLKYLHVEKAIGTFTFLQEKPACMRNMAILSGRQ